MLPTYAFLVCIAALLGGRPAPLRPRPRRPSRAHGRARRREPLTLFLVLRAFASGGAALTGVEAISDGVPAFQKPEWVNAQKTLTAMVVILAITFAGITYPGRPASASCPAPTHERRDGRLADRPRRSSATAPLYYAVQFATFLILVLAANTAFSDFPRLAYFLARDGFLPHQFTFRGDRLAYSVGIVALGVAVGRWCSRLRRRDQRADPAVRLRRVQRLHAVAGGHGRALVAAARAGLADAASSSTASARSPTFAGAAGRGGHQVPRRRLDGRGPAADADRLFRRSTATTRSADRELAPETPIDPAEITPPGHRADRRLNQVALQTLAYARSIARDADEA